MLTGILILLCLVVPACLAGWWTARSDALAQRMPLLAACGAVGAVAGVGALAVSAEASDAVAQYLTIAATLLSACAAIGGVLIALRLARGEGRP